MTIRILLVDDQELLRAGFKMVLDVHTDIEVVGEAANGDDALRMVATTKPDVVLMDIRMPAWTVSKQPDRSARAEPTCRGS